MDATRLLALLCALSLTLPGCNTTGSNSAAQRHETEVQPPPPAEVVDRPEKTAPAKPSKDDQIVAYATAMEKARSARAAERAADAGHRFPTEVVDPSAPVDEAVSVVSTETAAPPAPPALVNVSAHARRAPAAIATGGGVSPASPNTAGKASDVPADLREFVQRLSARGGDQSFREQLDRRMLCALAGDYGAARAPLELVTAEQQEMARQFVEGLIVMRESHGGDPGGEARQVLERMEKLVEALAPVSDLTLPKLEVCRAVKGLGLYDPIDPPHFKAGQYAEFVAYCEVRNLASRKTPDGSFETLFDVRTTILSRSGDKVHESESSGVKTVWREPRRECFIAPLVALPATLPPGEYVAKVTVADKIGAKVAERRVVLRIVPGS